MAYLLSPSSVSSSLSPNLIYDVFLTYLAADVRTSFLRHILKELRSKGINSFTSNDIAIGRSTRPQLIEAIRGSRMAIVVLSRNYVSSSRYLDELAEIMKCREELGQKVIPIFYQLNPAHVREQTGLFGHLFRRLCEGKTKQEIRRWSQALVDVSTIDGYRTRNWLVLNISNTSKNCGISENCVYEIFDESMF